VTRARERLPAPVWTEFGQLVSVLRKRWDTGRYLRAYAASEPWEPLALPVKGPTAAEFLDHFDAARRWATDFERDAGAGVGSGQLSVEYRIVQAEKRIPLIRPWIAERPLVALSYRGIWDQVMAVVEWIAAHDASRLYLRQMDVEGVDTKFVERHQRLLDELLTAVLPPDRVDLSYSARDFTLRFGFLAKPGYTRFRLFSESRSSFPLGVTELTLRTDELAEFAPDVTTVFVVENEVTYLAFPEVADSIVVFGSGFALTALRTLPWLQGKRIIYWGDIDTHGFDILSRLRARIGTVRSMLMDTDTLLAHANQWVTEPSPTSRHSTETSSRACTARASAWSRSACASRSSIGPFCG